MRLKFWSDDKKEEIVNEEIDKVYKEKQKRVGEATLRLHQTMSDLEQATNKVIRLIEKKATGH